MNTLSQFQLSSTNRMLANITDLKQHYKQSLNAQCHSIQQIQYTHYLSFISMTVIQMWQGIQTCGTTWSLFDRIFWA